MSEREFAKIIGKNLRRIMYEKGITQAQMASELGINKTTISSWMNGVSVPRMSKIDMLCCYLNCRRSDLTDEHAADSLTATLTQEEISLIFQYRRLNKDGRAKVRENLDDYLGLAKYTRKGDVSSSSKSEVIA